MNLRDKTIALRRNLAEWAKSGQGTLKTHYKPMQQKKVSACRRWFASRIGPPLRQLLSRCGLVKMTTWNCGLNHSELNGHQPLLIWADVKDIAESRAACAALNAFFLQKGKYTPVLVTPFADFAFYSRLGWLVEYLPAISGEGESYLQRKQRYLAWRYADVPAIPLSAGTSHPEDIDMLLK